MNEVSPLLACSQRPQFEQPGNGIGAQGVGKDETVTWIEHLKDHSSARYSLCSLTRINPCSIFMDEVITIFNCSGERGRERESE